MTLCEQMEKFLWRQGFVHARIRRAAARIFCISGIFFLAGLLALPWTAHFFWAGAMSILSCLNFYTIALFAQRALPEALAKSPKKHLTAAKIVKKSLLIHAFLRLSFSGFLLYIALAFFQAHPAALAAGLSFPLALIPVFLLIA